MTPVVAESVFFFFCELVNNRSVGNSTTVLVAGTTPLSPSLDRRHARKQTTTGEKEKEFPIPTFFEELECSKDHWEIFGRKALR